VKRPRRSLLIPLVVGVAALVVLVNVLSSEDPRTDLTVNEFLDAVDAGEVRTAEIKERDQEVLGELRDDTRYRTTFVGEFADELVQELRDATPPIEVTVDRQAQPFWSTLLISLLPILLLVGLMLFLLNSGPGGGRVMQFGKSRAKRVQADAPKVTFSDVAGADEAVEELREVVDFLRDPSKFQSLGAKIPKGVLLYGPPGTGKTLLARSVAGESGVPFFSISGSDFVEMFVGVGASRVRDLFEQAKQAAPAIVFVDEIDAVGRHRGAGLGGGHDEREQTLNQLLVEMDGFDPNAGVILMAATNRPDILDPALLRPGRFDRQIVIDLPDVRGREAILQVHAKGKPLADDVSLELIARRTPGFSGADLANLLNEAALLAARRGRSVVAADEVEDAIDRVIAGPERRTRVLAPNVKRVVAYHEAGHALVGHALEHCDPIHRVSIVSRGRALGWTLALPEEDRVLRSRSELIDELAMILGGRTAEELVFGEITTGAANDIERATNIARAMVTEYGMSDELGLRRLGRTHGEVFLGKEVGHEPDYSDTVAAEIDSEIRRLIESAHADAVAVLTTNRAALDALAAALIDQETLEEVDLRRLLAGVPRGSGRYGDGQTTVGA
jgi:cell division protease FtsH